MIAGLAAEAAAAEARALFADLVGGSRRALAKAITLVESSRADHRLAAQELLAAALRHARRARYGRARRSFRIGFTGPPGVGKSTFIEAFGVHLLGAHRRLAVLAIDPSSQRTGGSILGDKTRMERLAAADAAYVRPSPSRGALGGVARNTQEAILLCEAAGYDTVFVESVGVGQSEVILADMVDMYVLMVPPAGGDELQGIKRGVMELADLLVVNKADGELEAQATRTQTDYRSALMYLPPVSPHWRPRAMRVSALTGKGIPEVWDAMCEYQRVMVEKGEWDEKRGRQNVKAMWRQISDALIDQLRASEAVRTTMDRLEREVFEGEITSGRASDEVLARFFESRAQGVQL
ncbi:arginine/ornithine transport system ATPase [Hyaloraphidium curvatum]|nr:arginine/ornithine transport system ATPase [Hyaloraphidium curvatum]